ncbi:MAG: ABC transporter substrate-binding protein [Actinobacteria bacterium]|nr:ABC transporter substrate-binding protein [Actinomycetota bacterium]
MKRWMVRIVSPVVGIALLALAGCAPAEDRAPDADAQPGPTRIVVADASSTHHLNLYVAQELGFFEERDLEVEIIKAEDLAASRDAVVSGRADIFWSCPTVAIAAIANGAPLKTIAQVKTPCTSVLLVSEDSPIETYADLDGKSIAGISPTCEAVIAYSKKAREAGAEFNLEKLAGGPAVMALEAGRIDGAILEEPHASIAELKGFRIVLPETAAEIACRTINVRTAFLEDNADAAKRFIEAIDEANALIAEDPVADRIVEIAAQYTGAPEDAIRNGNARLLFTTAIQVEGLSYLADELVALENIRENPGTTMFAEEFRGITWDE